MRKYSIYNTKLDRKLIHPKIGVWLTSDLEEAKALLQDCKDYMDEIKVPYQNGEYVVIDIETEEIICE